jgi:hypothetical protein
MVNSTTYQFTPTSNHASLHQEQQPALSSTVRTTSTMGLKINGTIKQYIKAKEFGFIAPDDGSKDVLVELRDFKGVCQASGTNNQWMLTSL